MLRAAVLEGHGEVRITALGLADAELIVEKELKGLFPAASVRVTRVVSLDDQPRIAGSFEVSFTLRMPSEVEAEPVGTFEKRAFAEGRRAISGTRYERLEWRRILPV